MIMYVSNLCHLSSKQYDGPAQSCPAITRITEAVELTGLGLPTYYGELRGHLVSELHLRKVGGFSRETEGEINMI
jgi:hypothetical protein